MNFFSRILRKSNYRLIYFKYYSTSSKKKQTKGIKVCVIGSSGGIGQPLSLLLKLNNDITHLTLYDLVGTEGVAADLSHIDSIPKLHGEQGPEHLEKAMKGADIVVIPAGLPRKKGMSRDDLFTANANVICEVASAAAVAAPEARFAIITNPVNVVVPLFAAVMEAANVYNPCKIFGVSTLDCVRASAFVGEIIGEDPRKVHVPIVGGHAGTTIVPLLSQTQPCVPDLKDDEYDKLVKKIQEAGTEVVKAKAKGLGGSATLSMAYAGSKFVNALIKGMKGENVVECTYVASELNEAPFFASPIKIGKDGVEKFMGLPKMSEKEHAMVCAAIPELIKSAEKGRKFVKGEK